ncbi:DUF6081 family protein [Streptomyces coelicolor]|uniref:Uncharacterized protein n=1 Tax=Streptomyces coelicolor (strain ATCC BAA-471 / A3(2) / M145) TaxID=100226 RepID=Q93IZ2_STRCO|nr:MULTISPECIES: DUF6081 family protein [Streptomyces]MDX2928907.1 DUF6081 family protein [Streptomyces sp. NRRL_B-16638]MDX3346815.1 DUF6081 family protein [Streptomyces sp. ME02-6979A]MDX3407649.1 DUF6081 family protein [Streptomyces sp. ME02-6977A]MYU44600.1 hypothetical protein [Streptomyces sp. SID7813]QFI44978.1 hypothetical protein FQ762_26235 [Streptomyces coelicolor A3(2)]
MSTEIFHEEFAGGLVTEGPGAPWRLRPVDGLEAGDGLVRGGPDGLVVVPSAAHPGTRRPAFTEPKPGPDGTPLHLRWGAFTTGGTTGGTAGARAAFTAVPGERLSVRAEMGLRGFGLRSHPYDDVTEPDADARLGAGGLISVDLESGIIFDFFLTHSRLYAVYERLALRPDAEFAAFTYCVPVADRTPGTLHRLEVGYDVAAGTAHWTADGQEVLSVDRIGFRALDARWLRRDNGGREEAVRPRGLSFGLGLFLERHFGQGVRLSVRRLSVLTSPAGSRDS